MVKVLPNSKFPCTKQRPGLQAGTEFNWHGDEGLSVWQAAYTSPSHHLPTPLISHRAADMAPVKGVVPSPQHGIPILLYWVLNRAEPVSLPREPSLLLLGLLAKIKCRGSHLYYIVSKPSLPPSLGEHCLCLLRLFATTSLERRSRAKCHVLYSEMCESETHAELSSSRVL
jgi:hypothetical protein